MRERHQTETLSLVEGFRGSNCVTIRVRLNSILSS